MYCLQIAAFATLSALFGNYLDNVQQGEAIHKRLIWALGVQFTVIGAVVMVSTFIPTGACALNPKTIGDQDLEDNITECGFEEIVVETMVRDLGALEADTPGEPKQTAEADSQETRSTAPKIEQRSFRQTFRSIRDFGIGAMSRIPWPAAD